MWSLLLCGECFSWVIPAGGHCPDCMAPLRPETPDPSLETLRTIIGDLLWKLGYCRVVRRGGDIPGTLYLTSGGLFFTPHAIEETMEVVEGHPRRSWFWFMVELAIPYIRLISWVTAFRKQKQQVPVKTFYPQLLLAEDSRLLPQLLLGNPGAFFLPRERVQALFHRHNRWTIDRTRGKDVVLLEDPEDREFSEKVYQLSQRIEWRSPLAQK